MIVEVVEESLTSVEGESGEHQNHVFCANEIIKVEQTDPFPSVGGNFLTFKIFQI